MVFFKYSCKQDTTKYMCLVWYCREGVVHFGTNYCFDPRKNCCIVWVWCWVWNYTAVLLLSCYICLFVGKNLSIEKALNIRGILWALVTDSIKTCKFVRRRPHYQTFDSSQTLNSFNFCSITIFTWPHCRHESFCFGLSSAHKLKIGLGKTCFYPSFTWV